MGDPYTYQGLREENERLKIEVMELRNKLERLEERGKPRARSEVLYVSSRRKGTGARYDVIRINHQHRKILFTLVSLGAVSGVTGVPSVQIRKTAKMGQSPCSGRMAELIRKGFTASNKVKVLFQPDSEGSWRFRPQVAYDPNISARHYKRFVFWITEAGRHKLIETVRPSDDFVKADLPTLIELKRAAEGREELKKTKEGLQWY